MRPPPAELLEKYDKPGPRYTSYPTAPCWSEEYGPEDHAQRLAAAGGREAPLSMYVHLPYCESMCFYCGCSVVISRDKERGRTYVDHVLREAELALAAMGRPRPVIQHHWGGGTPTFLPAPELTRLFAGLSDLFEVTADAEVSIEVDPRVTSFEQLAALRSVGFNRLSMGVQDFDPVVQKAIHRAQSIEQTTELVAEGRRLGFGSLNLDLVYGLPHQTPLGFGRTLDTILAMRPERVACYGYAHVPWAVKNQKAIDESALPTRRAKVDLYLLALERLTSAGYEAIGMDHFAVPEDAMARGLHDGSLHRNFMGYTVHAAADMVSFGATAISEVDGAFAQNHKGVQTWRDSVLDGRLPVHRGLRRTADDDLRRRIILDLMCRFRLCFADHGGPRQFRDRHAQELAQLEPMARDGLIEIDQDGISVTEIGRLFVRNVAMVFDARLRRQQGSQRPTYSRTV